MTVYGLTEQGLSVKTRAVILDEIKSRLRDSISQSLDLGAATVDGQKIAVQADREGAVWDLLQILVGALNPDDASGAMLRGICQLSGTVPPPPRYSTVTMTLVGDNATVVDAGSVFRVPDTEPTRLFETIDAATLADLDAWADTTVYTIGDYVSNVDRSYVCRAGGTSAGSGGPTTTDADITDGSVHWRYLGEGTAAFDAPCRSSVVGAIAGLALTITGIDTPTSGLNATINLLDAAPGNLEFSDAELRILREVTLAKPGNGTIKSLIAELRDLDGVTAVTIFRNVSSTPVVIEGSTMPPHSIEPLVTGGDDQTIIDTIGEVAGHGIETVGTELGTWVDPEGDDQEIRFSRPEDVPIYVQLDVTIDVDEYPADGDDQLKAIVAAIAMPGGKNVVSRAIGSPCFPEDDSTKGVAGVLDVVAKIGIIPGPALTTTIAITRRQQASLDTSRITVTTTPGSP